MPDSIEIKLESQREALKVTEADIEKKNKDKIILKNDIATLEKISKEINHITDAYAQAHQTIQRDTTDLDNYLANKKAMIEAPVKDKKDAIISKIVEVDKGINDINKEIENLQKVLDKVQAGYNKAEATRNISQSDYDSYKTRQKEIDNALKELKDLKAQIGKEEDKNNVENMYFYIQELDDLLNALKPRILDKEGFKSAVISAWGKINENEEDLRTKATELETAKNNLSGKLTELEKAKASRRKNILDKLAAI